MNKWLIRGLLLLAYCIPYAFLAINGDAKLGTMVFYIIMIVAFSVVCWISIRTRNIPIIFGGNVFSAVSSFAFEEMTDLATMNYYFKPFTARQLIVIISIIALVVQTIVVLVALHRKKVHLGKAAKSVSLI